MRCEGRELFLSHKVGAGAVGVLSRARSHHPRPESEGAAWPALTPSLTHPTHTGNIGQSRQTGHWTQPNANHLVAELIPQLCFLYYCALVLF